MILFEFIRFESPYFVRRIATTYAGYVLEDLSGNMWKILEEFSNWQVYTPVKYLEDEGYWTSDRIVIAFERNSDAILFKLMHL